MKEIAKQFIITSVMLVMLSLSGAWAAITLNISEINSGMFQENVELKIAYENYYQSRQRVAQARADLYPRLDFNIIGGISNDAFADSVAPWLYLLPTPSELIRYKGSKYVERSAKYAYKAIELNIQEQLVKGYYNIKRQEELLKSLEIEKNLYAGLVKQYEGEVALGARSEGDLYKVRRSLLLIAQQVNVIQKVIAQEKMAMKIALGQDFDEELVLEDVNIDQGDYQLPDVDVAVGIAQANSNEIKSKKLLVRAAKYGVKGARLEFISFSGIGFDYLSSVAIEKSKRDILKLEVKDLEIKIANQVAFGLEEIKLLEEKITYTQQMVAVETELLSERRELYEVQRMSLTAWMDFQVYLIQEKRSLVDMKYERLVKLNSLYRLLGISSDLQNGTNNELSFNIDEIELVSSVEKNKRGRLEYVLNLTGSNLGAVESVVYDFQRFSKDGKGAASGFKMLFNSRREYPEVLIIIKLKNGSVFEKLFNISLDY